MNEIEQAEDRGYRNAINDVVQWHTDQLQQLKEKIKETHIEAAPGRFIQIGAVWEGKHCSASELLEVAHYHAEMLKVLEDKFRR